MKRIFNALAACAAAMTLCAGTDARTLSRGLAGVSTEQGYYLSWRMLPQDKALTSFDIYRTSGDGPEEKINDSPITATSDFLDRTADLSEDNLWILKSDGKELAKWKVSAGEARPYLEIPVSKPGARNIFRVTQRAYGTSDSYNPGDEGDEYSFSAGDCSIGDLDGDGDMEIVLKWNPSKMAYPEKTGVSGNTILDAYKLDGTLLWRIDLGHNIRSTYLSVPFVVYDLDGDGKAELVCKTADGTVDGTGAVLGNPRADWRSMDEASETFGRTVVGPEYLSVFDGATGKVIDIEKFIPLRFPLDSWGGIGGNDNVGIRSENYTAGVAYLDGEKPSVFFTRGADARTVVAAWDFDGSNLISKWVFDSSAKGFGKYSGGGNPNVSVADFDGDGADEICVGSMTVDNDGKGLAATGLRGGMALHAGSFIPGREGVQVFGTHANGDVIGAFLETPAMALYDGKNGEIIWSKGIGESVGRGVAADIDPRSPGAEVWVGAADPDPSERRFRPMPPRPQPATAGKAGNGPADASAAPPARPRFIEEKPELPKYEGALKGLYSAATGARISGEAPSSCNFILYWDADPQSELLDGTVISKWNWEKEKTDTLFKAEGVKAINGTKAVPCFSGDILGDWREEVVWITDDESALRIYMTPIPAADRRETLLADRQYRLSLVWQNVGHNQPPHVSSLK